MATGFTARARRRAAKKLLATFTPHIKDLLRTAPVLHADETTGRAAGALAYVHVACTEYLTLMHVGGRGSDDIDKGGVLKDFTGVLVRDGYAGYEHLPAIHAWCGSHLIRDLRSISDADPQGQLWATAMAHTLTAANTAAHQARSEGRDHLDPDTLATLINHYLGALAKGTTDNLGHRSELADKARTLIRRFRRYQDMILRFTTDLAVPWTNNQAERDVRPVKIQQRNGGGGWRTRPTPRPPKHRTTVPVVIAGRWRITALRHAKSPAQKASPAQPVTSMSGVLGPSRRAAPNRNAAAPDRARHQPEAIICQASPMVGCKIRV